MLAPLKTVLFVGGGSIGHVAPSVAVAQALRNLSSDVAPLFLISTRPEEAEYLRTRGQTFRTFPLVRFSLTYPLRFLPLFFRARALLRALRPEVLFGKGGAMSFPIALAARSLGIPLVLHESDAVTGITNRMLTPFASAVVRGYPGRGILTGNPVDPAHLPGNRGEGFRRTGLSPSKPVLLVVGGSQGSVTLNSWVAGNIDALLAVCSIIHLTGSGKETAIQRSGYWSVPFAFTELPELYAIADLAVSRAGASAIAELSRANIPTVLVPLEGVARNHQRKNADTARRSGFLLVPEDRIAHDLLPIVQRILRDEEERNRLKEAIGKSLPREPAIQIAKVIVRYLEDGNEGL